MREKRGFRRMVCAALILCVGAAPQSKPLRVVNVMPAFWNAWDSTEGQPLSIRVGKFTDEVVTPNKDVYGFSEFQRNLDESRIAHYLDELKPIAPQMRSISDRLARQMPEIEREVAAQLPGFSSDRIVVYFLPSFGHFVGQTHDLAPQKTAVMFGVDMIAQYEGADANIGVDVAHELFHIYQHEMRPTVRSDQESLWQAVWEEGSAAYASQALTPGSTQADALSPELAGAGADALHQLACGIKRKWSSHDDSDLTLYLNAGVHPAHLPSNGGYLVGYLAARNAARTRTLAQIASLDGAELESVMRDGVNALCATAL